MHEIVKFLAWGQLTKYNTVAIAVIDMGCTKSVTAVMRNANSRPKA